MIGVHSNFESKSVKDLSVVELYLWVYSILTWKESGNNIRIYCDETTKETMDYYGITSLYDDVMVRDYSNRLMVVRECDGPVCIFKRNVFFTGFKFTKEHRDIISGFHGDDSLIVFNSYDLKVAFIGDLGKVTNENNLIKRFEEGNCGVIIEGEIPRFLFDGHDEISIFNRKLGDDGLSKMFFLTMMREKLVEIGYPKFGKVMNLTIGKNRTTGNSLIREGYKLYNMDPLNLVTNELFDKWMIENHDLIYDDRFELVFWGSIGGADIDVIISKRGNMTLKELESYILSLTYSGHKIGVSIEVLYVSDIEYFKEFRNSNPHKVLDDVLIGFYSVSEYESVGQLRSYGNLKFNYGPFNDAFYMASSKGSDIRMVRSIRELSNTDGYVAYSSEIYNTIYERFGIWTSLT